MSQCEEIRRSSILGHMELLVLYYTRFIYLASGEKIIHLSLIEVEIFAIEGGQSRLFSQVKLARKWSPKVGNF